MSPGETISARIPSLPPDMSDLPVAGLGDRLVQTGVLGEGGMGEVVAADDVVLGRSVAVKRPRAQSGPKTATALVTEARTLARLDHPNVVPIHLLGVDDAGRPVLVMKRVRGERWSDLAHAPLERHVELALRVADALSYAHAQGVLHRDVKLDNVMVGHFGEVFLMDWGCACPVDAHTTDIVGTPSYMAPEMARPGARIGPATDTFLLAATLHRVVTGKPRYPGATALLVLAAAESGHQPPWPSDLPAELGDILARATAAELADRTPDPATLATELKRFLAHASALALVAEARGRLELLAAETAANLPSADLRFAESHFAFRSVLVGWPECAEARAGMARGAELWVPWKLGTGEIAAVEGVLAAEPELATRWGADLAAAREVRDARERELLRVDPASGLADRVRLALTMLVAIAITFTLVRVTIVHRNGLDIGQVFGLGGFGFLVAVGVVIPIRHRLAASVRTRSVAIAIVCAAGASFVHRGFAWLAGADPEATLRSDLWVMAGVLALIGFSVEAAFVAGIVPYALGAIAMLVWPHHEADLFPASVLASVVVLGLLMGRRPRT